MIKQRILVVDDTSSNIKILHAILQNEFDVSAVVDGQECLDFLSSQPVPDLILLDVMMPGMNGYEVCRRLKQNQATKDIPVIFVTAMGEVEDETHGLELGAVDYITKPIRPPIVLARVKSHLLIKNQHDQLKKSISIMEHDSEMMQQKADLGIQAGGLAHDINNILAACLFIEFLPEHLPESIPEKTLVQEDADSILRSLQLGCEICQGYTSYLRDIGSQAKAQPVLPLLQPIDMYSRQFKGKTIKNYSENLPLLFCKGYQIKRVLVNLFTNACQAIENQIQQVITIKVWSAEGEIFISMQDNGPGIPAEVVPDIFKERFTTRENGTGLGLFIVKEIIDSHHGTIKVETKEGKGTIFTLSLPESGE